MYQWGNLGFILWKLIFWVCADAKKNTDEVNLNMVSWGECWALMEVILTLTSILQVVTVTFLFYCFKAISYTLMTAAPASLTDRVNQSSAVVPKPVACSNKQVYRDIPITFLNIIFNPLTSGIWTDVESPLPAFTQFSKVPDNSVNSVSWNTSLMAANKKKPRLAWPERTWLIQSQQTLCWEIPH